MNRVVAFPVNDQTQTNVSNFIRAVSQTIPGIVISPLEFSYAANDGSTYVVWRYTEARRLLRSDQRHAFDNVFDEQGAFIGRFGAIYLEPSYSNQPPDPPEQYQPPIVFI